MREILFRGKRNDNGEWVYGYFVSQGKESYIFEQEEVDKGIDLGGYLDCCQMREVIPETVGQYVGLRDRDGKKIFEGDILESPVKRVDQKYGHMIVIKDIRECKFAALYVAEYRVIGNVYDNPELLEVK